MYALNLVIYIRNLVMYVCYLVYMLNILWCTFKICDVYLKPCYVCLIFCDLYSISCDVSLKSCDVLSISYDVNFISCDVYAIYCFIFIYTDIYSLWFTRAFVPWNAWPHVQLHWRTFNRPITWSLVRSYCIFLQI